MARSFIAIHSKNAERLAMLADAATRTHHLAPSFVAPDFVVLADAPCLAIGRHDGVVVGHLFTRTDGARPVTAIPIGAAHAIAATKGDHLLSAFWGGYVAFVARHEGEWHALRDPSGEMPCCWRHHEDATLFASDADKLVFPGSGGACIDWTALGLHLGRMGETAHRTCLSGVVQLLPGDRVRIGMPAMREDAWSPWHFVGDQDVDTPGLAATIDRCCNAWSSSFERLCLTLSGGLDSSVVAACIAGHKRLDCLNFLSPGGEGDERRYAQAVASHLGIRWRSEELDLGLIDLDRATRAANPFPAGRLIGQAADHAMSESLGDRAGGAALNGEGGDNVFCFLQSPLPAVDRCLGGRQMLGFWTTLTDCSDLLDVSRTRALRWTARRLARPRKAGWRRNPDLLDRDVANTNDDEALPAWLSPPAGIPPGKAAHVAAIFRAHNRRAMLPAGQPEISPLLSQPIVEMALAIPSWRWCEGGRDRAPVRRGFSTKLPVTVLERRSKGGPQGAILELVASRRNEIRSRLLDGVLGRAGLLDKPAVEASLSDAGLALGRDALRIVELVEAEAWANHWQALASRRVADPKGRSSSPPIG